MAYRVEFTARAAKEMANLTAAAQKRIAARIDALAIDPRPPVSRKLQGAEDLYRVRTGDYRVIYQVQDRLLVVTVIRIGHRRDVYR